MKLHPFLFGCLFLGLTATFVRAEQRPVIYQLFVRHFGNTTETRKFNGTLNENGCGKFNDINSAALTSLREFGITHIWLTGVIQQATRTDYSQIGQAADDPDICKGLAGSPYAIKDAFDVCPDYAMDPSRRMDEFKALVQRCHDHQLKVILDFVPNHVSRAYVSDVRPDLSFGSQDDRSQFFTRDNSFFYLRIGSPPLKLPNLNALGCDGLFEGEREFGRVTGNNSATWTPSMDDWYETVKLNYGWNFQDGRPDEHAFGNSDATPPRTWIFMNHVLAHWQAMGVDGFRCDMAHMIPFRFWQWALSLARSRNPDVFFMAEAYDNDPAKLVNGNVLDALISAGFNAVYDDPSYDLIKGIYEDGKWANDLAALINNTPRFHQSLRYTENHDEVRLASPKQWRGAGKEAGPAISSILFGLGRGPIMIYNGQEVGEPAEGAEGYGGDDSRTSLFDYGSLPALVGWNHGHRYDGGGLSPDQKRLRQRYADLIRAMSDPLFQKGDTIPLNPLNESNPQFGRFPSETASGHWLCAFLREIPNEGTAVVVVNLHPTETFTDTTVWLPKAFQSDLVDLIKGTPSDCRVAPSQRPSLRIPSLPPMTARILRER